MRFWVGTMMKLGGFGISCGMPGTKRPTDLAVLILCWPLDMVDDEDFHCPFL
jgi:hypothetical protein